METAGRPPVEELPSRHVPRRGLLRWAKPLVTAAAAVALAVAGVAVGPPAAQAAAPTVVSLTFDDGHADQVAAAQTLNSLGLKATFFVTSGVVNTPNYFTLAQVQALAAAGHEIGGHTVTHPDLTTLPSDEATRQVCNDRVNLANWGFRVTSFAHPFAAANAATETIVKNCGYNSARGLGDIRTRFSCGTCAVGESMPPADPYFTKAPDQVENTWTLADLQRSVTQAENGAGGWVQLTFHHIANNPSDPITISPTLFNQFANWLKTRPSTTTVKTVDQVIGGTVKPLVSGPAVPPPGTGNLVKNPGFETLTNGVPQCWQQGGYGTNTPTFSTVTQGRTGRGAQIVMRNYSNGDAKWLPSLDLGGCSPAGTPGHTYNLGMWYKSTAATQFALYYRTGIGSWTYWTSSPWFAAASTFQKASWTTPALPQGASGISFGLNIFSNGTLVTDDAEMFDAAATPPPPPPAAGTNLVQNAGLETAGTGTLPQCWQAAGYGTNTPTYTTLSSGAHSGTKAVRLVMTNYSSGDSKLLPSLDTGSCAPPAVAGKTYSLRAWYTSTATTQFAVYYRNSAGAWVYWTSSPWLAAAGTYTQASFTTPALPAGATAISFGLNLFSNGTLITDDYAMYDTVGAPAL
ncbi:Polysaccharide deacetylase [Pseudarthrobacter enclensis]|uniref:Polysaccharide deacetylase n=1 Tax=Pseudarthrobacter enclensis TaxID=993070 RepID=A0A0V8IQ38_9MICC|nr:polysaccharide deacetylase family protein [Pseudarthrobacter enclensis]KSU76843.1 polysaccharide deacetylase [Pseudarthrobacter enclensis]SCC03643.1 Polysaccharide deacetylase [Pseudarthrobacter enclensis]